MKFKLLSILLALSISSLGNIAITANKPSPFIVKLTELIEEEKDIFSWKANNLLINKGSKKNY